MSSDPARITPQSSTSGGPVYYAPDSLCSYLGTVAPFALQWFQSPTAVGTPFPCSPFVAREILKNVPSSAEVGDQPRRFLEIGPGLGAFTTHFLNKMGPNDTLDLVEIEEVFCNALRDLFQHDTRVSIHCLSITNWKPTELYDHIVTAVPLNSLNSPELVADILKSYQDLQKPTGTLSGVEYVGTTVLKSIFMCRGRVGFDRVIELKRLFFSTHEAEPSTIVYGNIPPARVMHCSKMAGSKKES